jgi:hypothetical protein
VEGVGEFVLCDFLCVDGGEVFFFFFGGFRGELLAFARGFVGEAAEGEVAIFFVVFELFLGGLLEGGDAFGDLCYLYVEVADVAVCWWSWAGAPSVSWRPARSRAFWVVTSWILP